MRFFGLAILGTGLLCLVVFFGLPGLTAWQLVIQNFAHGPVFALLAIVTAGLLRLRWPAGHQPGAGHYILVFLLCMLLGVLTELAQGLYDPGRSVSAGDLFRDLLGTLVGLGIIAAWDWWHRGLRRPWLLVAGLVAGLVLLAPPFEAAAAYALRAHRFPVLVSPAQPLYAYFLEARGAELERVPLAAEWSGDPREHALRVRLQRPKWPGLALIEPQPDWRSYRFLVLDLVNPDEVPLPLMLRVLDREHDWRHEDRFNRRIDLPPRSRQLIRIPLEDIASAPDRRRMDMSRIADLLLFRSVPGEPSEFLVVRIALE
jgi:hypothetical protein